MGTEYNDKTVAVVIPLARSLLSLKGQVDALLPQLLERPNRTLVLAVNDSGLLNAKPIKDYVAGLTHLGATVHLVNATQKKGAASARNVGWRSVSSDYYLFCDDDDIVSRTWIEEMTAFLGTYDLVGGRLDFALLNSPELAKAFSKPTVTEPKKFDHLPFSPTCNLGASKSVLQATNGFDEELINGEDIDFCWRAQYLKFNFALVDGATVHYRLRSDFKSTLKQYFIYGRSDGQIMRKHRDFGARRLFKRTLKDLFALTLSLCLAPFVLSKRFGLAQKLGTWVGHIVGMVEFRVWLL